MLDAYWSGIGGKLADRFTTALFSPVFGLWVVLGVAFFSDHGQPTVQRYGWLGAIRTWSLSLTGLPAVVQIALALVPLLVLVVTALFVTRASLPVVRLLEGYWWPVLDRPRGFLLARLSRRCDADLARLRVLAARPGAELTADELAERGRLERRRWRTPLDPRYRMPTRLGNAMRAAELRPSVRYGLDAVVCWPRLWLLLPDATRQDIAAARASLYLRVQVWLCGVLAILGTIWAWWALPLGVAVALVTYYGPILGAAGTYADLVGATYDVHRRLLYDALRWPYPASPAAEQAAGIRLTLYLSVGSRQPDPIFTPAAPAS